MKVQAKHDKVTQNMHGASKNYRYVWDVSAASAPTVAHATATKEDPGRRQDPDSSLNGAPRRSPPSASPGEPSPGHRPSDQTGSLQRGDDGDAVQTSMPKTYLMYAKFY